MRTIVIIFAFIASFAQAQVSSSNYILTFSSVSFADSIFSKSTTITRLRKNRSTIKILDMESEKSVLKVKSNYKKDRVLVKLKKVNKEFAYKLKYRLANGNLNTYKLYADSYNGKENQKMFNAELSAIRLKFARVQRGYLGTLRTERAKKLDDVEGVDEYRMGMTKYDIVLPCIENPVFFSNDIKILLPHLVGHK